MIKTPSARINKTDAINLGPDTLLSPVLGAPEGADVGVGVAAVVEVVSCEDEAVVVS